MSMAETLSTSDAFAYYPRLRRAKAFVLQHLEEPLSLGRVAAEIGLSRTYFSKYFYDKTGLRYSEWLMQTRVEHATRMLREQDFSIAHVAGRSGYQDMRTFERNFKRVTGMTAMQYKKTYRRNVRGGVNLNHPARPPQSYTSYLP
ncbi:MAG: hypothetical protein Tsb002_15150 [Wenzhouxiangellaceae bacterium]